MSFFQPTDITGIFCWWRAHDINLGSNSGTVSYWQDVSGSGNHLTVDSSAASSTACPTWVPQQLNGYPIVRFNGSSHWLSASGNYNGSSYYFSNLQPSSLTSFIVYNTQSSTIEQSIFANDNPQANRPALNNFVLALNTFSTTSGWSFQSGKEAGGGITTVAGTGFSVPENTWLIRSDRWRRDNNQFTWARDGADLSSGYNLYMSSQVTNQLKVGASVFNGFAARFFWGDIAEIVAYDRRINESEVNDVHTYLKQKYNIGGGGGFPLFLFADTPSGIYSDIPLFASGANVQASTINSSINLYTESTTLLSSGIKLYTTSANIINSSVPLYEFSLGSGNSNLTLYVGNSLSLSGSPTLYTYGKDTASGLITLFMLPTLDAVSGCSLYIGTAQSGNKSIPLYIGSTTPIASGFDLFTYGAFIKNSGFDMVMFGGLERGNFPLFISPYTSGFNYTTLFIENTLSSPSSVTLFTFAHSSGAANMPLTIFSSPPSQSSGNIPLVMTSPTSAGTSGIFQSTTLFIDSFGNSANMPLFISTETIITSGVQSSIMPLFIFGPQTSGTNYNQFSLFVGNYFSQIGGPRLKMYVRGDGTLDGGLVGNSNMPLFLGRLPGNSMSLYMASNIITNDTPLYLPGAYVESQGVSCVIEGMGMSSGNSLYILGPGFISQGINLTISGQPLKSSNINLYSHGFA